MLNVGEMLGHSLAILMTTYAHLARLVRYASCGLLVSEQYSRDAG